MNHSSTTNSSQKSAESQKCEAVINEAVTALKSVFSGWRAAFKTETEFNNYRREFLLSLVQFRITTQEQIERGIDRARQEASKGREFMPSPAQFAGWCQPTPADLGICTFERAYHLTISRQWEKLHPAFQHVAREFDLYSMRRLSDRDSRREFRPLYDQVIERVGQGEKFARITAISARSEARPPADQQRVAESRAACLALLGITPKQGGAGCAN